MGILLLTDDGVRVTSPVTNFNAVGAAAAVVIFTIPVLVGQLVGVKSAVIKRVKMLNNAAGNQIVHIGTGVGGAFVDLLPGLTTMNNLNDNWPEGDLPGVEAFADITAYLDAIVAAGTIDIELELLIRG